jgi:hypothetical protein
VTFSAVPAVCVDAAAFNLTQGSPVGGAYSGTGITASPSFNPATAGAGTHTITYTYTDGNGCVNSTTQTVTVNLVPTPVITGVVEVCEPDQTSYAVTALPGHSYSWTVTGGTISGASTSSSVLVDWVGAGAGTVEASEVIDATGCMQTTPMYNVTKYSLPVLLDIVSNRKLTRR